MEDYVELALEGATTGIDHYEKVYDPLKEKVQKLPNPIKALRSDHNGRDQYDDDDRSYESDDEYRSPRRANTERGGSRRHRDSRRGDVYVEESYERRSGRAKSAGRDGARGLGREGRSKSRRKAYYSDSESSLSPPRRRRKSLGEQALAALGIGGGVAAIERDVEKRRDEDRDRSRRRRRQRRESDREYDRYRRQERFEYDDPPRRAETFSENTQQQRMPAGYLGSNVPERDLRVATRDANSARSTVSTRDNARGSSKRSSSSSSSSSSSVCSSSEDERRIKKMKGKEFLTAGLAAVATIHAAAGLYSSMEARDKRHEEVLKGEMTPEESRRKRNKARLQDAAAIGIAALGIKGAYSEWQEVQESRNKVAEQKSEWEKRHEKRVRKAERAARREREARSRGGRYDDRDRYRNGGYDRDGYRSA